MGVSEGNRAHETTPDSVLASESSEVRPAKLQKHSGDGAAPAAEPKKWTFKAVGNAVLAMKRFQASLNPTYTYGKQHDKPPSTTVRHVRTPSPTHLPGVGVEAVSPPKDAPQAQFQERVSRASYLFRPLPELPTESTP